MKSKRSANPNRFFSKQEKELILKSIREAETATSGEIRLHLERKTKKDVYQRALTVFHKIGMNKTAQRNGVLIYLATGDHKFVILGDEGINQVVPDNFWEDAVAEIVSYFKKEEFCEGVCRGIEKIGEKLKTYFPYQSDDINELPDEISIGEK